MRKMMPQLSIGKGKQFLEMMIVVEDLGGFSVKSS